MHENSRLAVGLDIGSSNVRCVIGSVDGVSPVPNIVGVGEAPNKGVRKGTVVNIVETAQAIDAALEQAERMCGTPIKAATVNINGTHIVAMSSKGVVAVNSPNNEIAETDLIRAEEAATVVQLPANREILQVTPRSYRLDDQEGIKDPIGMTGVRLEVDAHVIIALTPNVKNLVKAMEMSSTAVNKVMMSGLAASKAVLSTQQMENGVVLVDIGGSTTNIVVYEEGDLNHVAVLPMGSTNITNDLAIGLRTDLDVAEVVKLNHAQALPRKGKDAPKTVKFKHGSETHEFSVKDVDMIVEARLEEIFELVDEELRKIDRSGKLPGGVVLTGGGAQMRGIDEFVKDKMRLPARIARQALGGMGDKVSGPEFATSIGLMLTDLETPARLNRSGTKDKSMDKWFGVATDLFKRFKS